MAVFESIKLRDMHSSTSRSSFRTSQTGRRRAPLHLAARAHACRVARAPPAPESAAPPSLLPPPPPLPPPLLPDGAAATAAAAR